MKRLLFLSFLCISNSFAQTNSKIIYPFQKTDSVFKFIKYKKNVLELNDTSNFNTFYTKLDSLVQTKKRKISIVHIGDSHIQADFFSGKMRNHFHVDSYFGNGGRGLAFPYPIVHTNNPIWYRVAYTGSWKGSRIINRTKDNWGINGVNAITNDAQASFSINQRSHIQFTFNKIKVFYPVFDSTMMELMPIWNDSVSYENMTIKKDTNLNYVEYQIPVEAKSVLFEFSKLHSYQNTFVLQGLSLENDSPGIVLHSIGINGASANSYLRSELFFKQLACLKPDLIIISLGTNEAYPRRFNENYFQISFEQFLAKIRHYNPEVPFLLTTPSDNMRSRRQINLNNAKAGKVIKNTGFKYGAAVWDLYTIMGGKKSISKWYKKNLCQRDKLHFTQDGYELQGELLYNAIMNDFTNYQKRKYIK